MASIQEFLEKKGTTTIGIVCSDGVILASDSRATMDTFIANSEAVKVYKINNYLGVTIAGSVGDAEYLIKLLKYQSELYNMGEYKLMSPNAATSLLSIILQENKYFPFLVQFIVGGINVDAPELFSIDPVGGVTRESKFISTGSGSLFAIGYLENSYSDNMNVQEGIRHAVKALQIAMKRDSATGDHIRVVSITKKGGYKEYTKEEIEKIMKEQK
ncbi:MAG: archaeal proteasome endopeptidase complex subunit beta [Candidatus Micrarchaeaceae archaeon]